MMILSAPQKEPLSDADRERYADLFLCWQEEVAATKYSYPGYCAWVKRFEEFCQEHWA